MVQYKLPIGLWDAAHGRRGGERINKSLGNTESTLAGIWKKTFTKIEAYSGMVERPVIDLAVEEALQDEMKEKTE